MAGNGYDQLIAQLNTLKSVPGPAELLRECAWSVPVYEERAKGWNYGELQRACRMSAYMLTVCWHTANRAVLYL